jgi:uncharacterized membrane protein YfcA
VNTPKRNGIGFMAGSLIGTLGGLIGLGGAEFRLPVLVGAWWAVGHAITLPRYRLDCLIMLLLVGLSLLMLWEAGSGLAASDDAPLFLNGLVRWMAGLIAGFGIGVVAALPGVVGGELLIPTLVLLYGFDIKIAGSLSLMVSLPTMLVGLVRYTHADAFSVLKQERLLMRWMVAGSILSAALGGLLLGWLPTRPLMGLLGLVLLISAIMTFKHTSTGKRKNTCF